MHANDMWKKIILLRLGNWTLPCPERGEFLEQTRWIHSFYLKMFEPV